MIFLKIVFYLAVETFQWRLTKLYRESLCLGGFYALELIISVFVKFILVLHMGCT